ncbi:Uncharacterised protein [Yersinia nurmii]|uniref:Phage protein n=1 Tax=Yersinia nurmii TaxID=685706 RepID=A0ABM9SN37_9GAMM|nr:hypothetical protein [Yersinia nurmii]CNF25187.1 Uncharacterised protein [Yersinia nurmii]
MMDITKSREEFEAWHRDKYKTKFSSGQPTRDMHNGKYADCYTVPAEQERWELWQASREIIVVELPSPLPDEGYSDIAMHNFCRNDSVKQCANAIRTAGIRIKGESE